MEKGFFFQTEHISCWFIDRGGKTLLVTFAEWGSNPEQPTRWGETLGRTANWSALGFETSEPNWYPSEDTVQAIEAAERHLDGRFPVRLALGVSQGGYAALKFGKLLKTAATFAFSPPFSIDPVIYNDLRFGSRYRPLLNSGMHISVGEVSSRAFVFYDPYDENDSQQAKLILSDCAATPIQLPFASHGATHLVSDPRTIIAMFDAALENKSSLVHRLAVNNRKLNKTRAYTMSLHLAYGRPAISLAIFKKFNVGPPETAWSNVCYRLAKAGFASEVVEWLKRTAARHPNNPELACCLALVALEAGDLELATDAAINALRLDPKEPKYAYVQGLILSARRVRYD